jgi:Pyruvate/2-oxoacid:ferredoxin oxidoreductase delta subunit
MLMTIAVRKIVKIDESLCDGCGQCIPSCVEGALKLIDGKARLVSDRYCDGLGACLGKCPRDAINIEERVADEFDEVAASVHLRISSTVSPIAGCPGSQVIDLRPVGLGPRKPASREPGTVSAHTELRQWPVQLALVPPRAPFLVGADVALIADCVPFACPDVHRQFIRDHVVLVACPKLDDFAAHLARLTAIVRQAKPRSLTVVHMEVPCCFGLGQIARRAVEAAESDIQISDVTIGTRGEILAD